MSEKKNKSGKLANKLKLFICDNPVLVSGLSLGPIVAIGQSLKAGLSLSMAFAVIIIPVLVIFAFIPDKLSKSSRVILCALLSSVFFIPAFWLAKTIFPEVNDKVGVFLPLMVVNPIINVRSSHAAKNSDPLSCLKNGIKTALGFAFVMCFVSALREFLGKGTLWDKPILYNGGNVSFLLPFTGFIMLGLMAAGVSFLSNKDKEAKK